MKTMKHFLLIPILLFMACGSMAQNNNQQDVVYLKNGGIIRGTLLELIPDSLVKIQTVDGNVFVYQIREVAKYSKEPYFYNQSQPIVRRDTTGLKRGFYGVVEYATGFSFGNAAGPLTTKMNFISGYRVCPWFAAGAGFGFRLYVEDGIYFPVYADLRVNFVNRNTSPFLTLQGGYSWRSNSNYETGGIMFSTTLGVCVKVKKNFALNIGLNYELQGTSDVISVYNGYYPTGSTYTRRNEDTHTVGFLFGFMF
jgi:hypothetical protein